ncbi:MAG: [Synergistaceae bacterium]|nr:[citrate (pro-3S)-lyase] ligase [Synergistaceae bacterium]
KFFGDLGFYEIVRIADQVVFMENRRTGFSDYLSELSKSKRNGKNIAALVLNANPFTLGHQYLVEKASGENDVLHVFIVSEDASLVPFEVRKKLVVAGTSHLHNIVYHDTGPYIISSATFPSYFQKDDEAVIESHANLDLEIFVKIAESLGINARYVGEEPKSLVTGIYNRIMSEKLPEHGIKCVIVPRKTEGGEVISASNVRQAIKEGRLDEIRGLVPESTYEFFASPEAESVIARIRGTANVIHY